MNVIAMAVGYFIKMLREAGKNIFRIQQGRSDADISDQPKNGFRTRGEATDHLHKKIREDSPFSFRKGWRKKR